MTKKGAARGMKNHDPGSWNYKKKKKEKKARNNQQIL